MFFALTTCQILSIYAKGRSGSLNCAQGPIFHAKTPIVEVALESVFLPLESISTFNEADSAFYFYDGTAWLPELHLARARFRSLEALLTEIESIVPDLTTTTDVETGFITFTFMQPNQRLEVCEKLGDILGLHDRTILDGQQSAELPDLNRGSLFALVCADCINPNKKFTNFDLPCLGVVPLASAAQCGYAQSFYNNLPLNNHNMTNVAIELIDERGGALPIASRAGSLIRPIFREEGV